MAKKRPTRETIDTGTRELSKRRRLKPQRIGTTTHVRVLDGNEIDRLLCDDLLTPEQHSVIVAFQGDMHRSSLLGLKAQDYGRPMGGGSNPEMSLKEAAILQRVGRAIECLDVRVGTEARMILLRVVMEDLPVRTRIREAQMKACADALIEFYSRDQEKATRRA